MKSYRGRGISRILFKKRGGVLKVCEMGFNRVVRVGCASHPD